MTVKFKGQLPCAIKDYYVDSSDTKPTEGVNVGATLIEEDTGNEYYFNGTTWKPSDLQSPILLTQGVTLTGNFSRIKARTDCTFTTFTSNAKYNNLTTALTAATLNGAGGLIEGDDIWADITVVNLQSGTAWLYR